MKRTARLSLERDIGREDANPGILPDVAYFAYGIYYMHIHYFCTYYAYYAYHDFSFPFAGHNYRMVIFKSAAYNDLSDEDLEEILSCYNEPA